LATFGKQLGRNIPDSLAPCISVFGTLKQKAETLGESVSIHSYRGDSGRNDDDDSGTVCILQQVAAYSGLTVLTEDEKMSAVL